VLTTIVFGSCVSRRKRGDRSTLVLVDKATVLILTVLLLLSKVI
jgi:hypothetical protein